MGETGGTTKTNHPNPSMTTSNLILASWRPNRLVPSSHAADDK